MAQSDSFPAIDFVRHYAAAQPDALACFDLDRGISLTYRQLDQEVDEAAARLASLLGGGHGERVGVLSRNSAQMLALQWACIRQGAIFVPLNWRLSGAELTVLARDCDLAVILHEAEFEAAATAASQACGARRRDLASDWGRQAVAPTDRTPLSADEPATLLYTSGTTGKPKGVICTEAGALASALNFISLTRIGPRSVLLCDAPMFHVIGLYTLVRSAIQAGARVLISSRFDPAVTYARLTNPALGVTHYMAAPQMTQALRGVAGFDGKKLSHLTGMMTGGAPHPAHQILAWAADGVKLADGYGMSEAGTVTCVPPTLEAITAHAGSVGLAGPATQVRLVGADGADVEPGQAGEIWLRGPAVSPGYWGNPDATAAARKDGWLRTGDVAYQDAEGFYVVCDRLKDMYISGGENVYPAEVEAVLLGLPDVAEAAVIGVPDAQWGEVGWAFIVGAAADEDVLSGCRQRLAGYKLPKRIVRLNALPRTASGKVRKHELRKQIEDKA